MKYKLKNDKIKFDPLYPIDSLLKINGIENPEEYEGAGEKDFHEFFAPYYLTQNDSIRYTSQDPIAQTATTYNLALKNKPRINMGIVVDCDVDGFCSASLLYKYFENVPKLNITPLFHTGKQHGLSEDIMEQIADQHFDSILIPDAGSNDAEQCKELAMQGTFIHILDHHEIDQKNIYAVVQNPYKFKDKSFTDLSGTAVTFMFLNDMDDYKPVVSDMELVALSLISDSMDCRSTHNRWILDRGFNHYPTHPLLKTIADNDNYNVIKELNPDYCSFNIVPKMNALIRMGSQEEKEYLFRAICGEEQEFDHKKRDGSIEKESLAQMVSRIGKNAQSRQTTAVGKDVIKLAEVVDSNDMAKDKVLILDSKDINSVLKGITASKISSKYNRPVIIGEYGEDEVFHGSIRNNCDYIDDFKAMLDESKLCTVAGHENAAGITFPKENADKIIKYFNDTCSDSKYQKTYYIDGEFDGEDVDGFLASQIDSFKKYAAPGIDRPKFLIHQIGRASCRERV